MAKVVNKIIEITSLGKIDMDPKKPKKPEVRTAPDPEAASVEKSRELQRRKRTGRTSTVLTDGRSTLG